MFTEAAPEASPSASLPPEKIRIVRTIFYRMVDDEPHFLMGKRRPGDYGAGKWEFIGGTLNENESPLAGMERESYEETSLRGNFSWDDLVVGQSNYMPDGRCREAYTFVRELHNPIVQTSSEHDGELEWVPEPVVKARLAERPVWLGALALALQSGQIPQSYPRESEAA